MLRPLYY